MILGSACAALRPPKEPGVACPRSGGEPLSRWQLYRLVAGGSRERLSARFCPSPLLGCGDSTAHRIAAPRDVPGSRLLLTHRAAMLRSGSPPGAWSAQPAACLQPFCSPVASHAPKTGVLTALPSSPFPTGEDPLAIAIAK